MYESDNNLSIIVKDLRKLLNITSLSTLVQNRTKSEFSKDGKLSEQACKKAVATRYSKVSSDSITWKTLMYFFSLLGASSITITFKIKLKTRTIEYDYPIVYSKEPGVSDTEFIKSERTNYDRD